MADDRLLQAWEALDLGPLWIRRTAPSADHATDATATSPPAADAEVMPGVAGLAVPSPIPTTEEAWAALRAEVATCRRCGLCESRRNTVFGTGPATARWMLIGEAPGADEDARGEPFVGPAGQLLTQMLAAAGLARDTDVFITNILKCRPPGNRNPEPAEAQACEPFLRRQIELLQPDLILLLGRFAAQGVLGTDASIAGLRQRVHHYAGERRRIPVVCTYHPAYLLRNLPDKRKSWEDLCLAVDVASRSTA